MCAFSARSLPSLPIVTKDANNSGADYIISKTFTNILVANTSRLELLPIGTTRVHCITVILCILCIFFYMVNYRKEQKAIT